jgi:hypothetical protein
MVVVLANHLVRLVFLLHDGDSLQDVANRVGSFDIKVSFAWRVYSGYVVDADVLGGQRPAVSSDFSIRRTMAAPLDSWQLLSWHSHTTTTRNPSLASARL